MTGSARRRGLGLPAAVILTLLVTLSGCSGSDAQDETAAVDTTADDARVNNARYECLLDRGLPVTRGPQGEVMFQDDKDRLTGQYMDAQKECDAELAAAGLIVQETPESLRAQYAVLARLHECLVRAGLPLVDFPSEQVFVDRDGATNVLEATSPVDLQKAQEACPEEFAAAGAT